MASEALLQLLSLNLAASTAIIAVFILRTAMRNWFGARVAYALWLAVPAAMIASTVPAREIVVNSGPAAPAPVLQAATAGAMKEWFAAALPMHARLDPSLLIMTAWIAGIVLSLGVLAWRQTAYRRSLGKLRWEAKGVMRSEASGTGPAIIGAIWPKVVLPLDFEARFDARERDLILAHEQAHLRGRDPTINGLTVMAQCFNWFNPLIHIAAHAMRIDQELACDAAVMARIPNARRRYAEAMLKTQIAPMSLPLGCYWPAVGEHPLKLRIAMLKRSLPGKRRLAAGAILAALAGLTSGCVVWSVQPPHAVAARVNAVSPAQAALNRKLLDAIQRGDARRAEAAIASGADVNARTASGTTALVIVAQADDLRILNLLLQHGADPNLISSAEGTALAGAARRGQIRSVVALVGYGAEVDRIAPGWGTPLAASARTGQMQVVQYLVEHGADVNLPSPLPAPWDHWGGARTPLQVALNNGDRSVIDYLKFKGAVM